jgi:hypothetical protein
MMSKCTMPLYLLISSKFYVIINFLLFIEHSPDYHLISIIIPAPISSPSEDLVLWRRWAIILSYPSYRDTYHNSGPKIDHNSGLVKAVRVCPFDMLVSIYQNTLRHSPEYCIQFYLLVFCWLALSSRVLLWSFSRIFPPLLECEDSSHTPETVAPVLVLSQMNPVPILIPYFLNIPSTSRSRMSSRSLFPVGVSTEIFYALLISKPDSRES